MRRPLALVVLAGFLALALAIAALGRGGRAYQTSHGGHATTSAPELLSLWALPPLEVAALLSVGALYLVTARRAAEVTWIRGLSFACGIGIVLLAVCSPLGAAAQQGLFTAHMLQHTLIGALAPLLLLLGPPRGLLAPGSRPGVALARVLRPVPAFVLWLCGTLLWLLPAVHEAVLANAALWILQQAAFLVLGLVLWAPVLEVLPGPRWFGTSAKIAYMCGVWLVGLVLANVYWFSGTAFYGAHSQIAATWGVSPLEDQANGGTVMLVLHCLLAFGAITILFFRQAREGELAQRLVEAGIDPGRVAEATRAGRGAALARSHGLSPRTRPGID